MPDSGPFCKLNCVIGGKSITAHVQSGDWVQLYAGAFAQYPDINIDELRLSIPCSFIYEAIKREVKKSGLGQDLLDHIAKEWHCED